MLYLVCIDEKSLTISVVVSVCVRASRWLNEMWTRLQVCWGIRTLLLCVRWKTRMPSIFKCAWNEMKLSEFHVFPLSMLSTAKADENAAYFHKQCNIEILIGRGDADGIQMVDNTNNSSTPHFRQTYATKRSRKKNGKQLRSLIALYWYITILYSKGESVRLPR